MYNQKPLPGDLLDYGCSLSDGIIGFWPFNEDNNSDKIFDLSGNNKNGTLINGPTWDDGILGPGVRMSGSEITEDHIDVGDESLYEFGNASTDEPFTFVVGYKPDSDTVGHYLVAKFDNILSGNLEYVFFLAADGGLEPRLQLNDDSTANRLRAHGTPIANPTALHHFAVTYDGSSTYAGIKLYVDGVINVSTDESQGSYVAMHPSSAHLRFGAFCYDNESYDVYADGLFEYVYIFNRALTDSEIALLYQNPFCMVGRKRRIIYDEIAAAGVDELGAFYLRPDVFGTTSISAGNVSAA